MDAAESIFGSTTKKTHRKRAQPAHPKKWNTCQYRCRWGDGIKKEVYFFSHLFDTGQPGGSDKKKNTKKNTRFCDFRESHLDLGVQQWVPCYTYGYH